MRCCALPARSDDRGDAMRRYGWLIAGLLLAALWAWSQRAPSPADDRVGTTPAVQPHDARMPTTASSGVGADYPSFLPHEARATLRLVASGGPFPHRQDGGVFQNRERRLPAQPRGYYREYTVRTPGSRDRGARRIIVGGQPPVEFFYTDDHYRSFRRFTTTEYTP